MNEQVIQNTIQKMREAGISESIIASTLSDLGLSSPQVQAYLVGGREGKRDSFDSSSRSGREEEGDESSRSSDLENEMLASRTSEKVVQRLEEREMFNQEEQSLKDNITHLALEQHGQQLKDTHQAVVELHDKFDAVNVETISNRVSSMNAKMDSLSKDIIETKALSLALQSLLQKILETNQQLLFEMKNRKG